MNTTSALLGAVGWVAHPCCASHCQSAQADCSRVRSSCDGVFHAVRTCTACLHWNKWYRCFLVDALLEQKPWSGAEPVSHKLPRLWATWIQSFSVLEMFVKSYSWPLASEQVACTLLINRATARAVSEQTKVLWEEDLLQLHGLERGGHAARSVTSSFQSFLWRGLGQSSHSSWVPQEPLQGVATGEYKGALLTLHCKAVQSSTWAYPFANGHVKY